MESISPHWGKDRLVNINVRITIHLEKQIQLDPKYPSKILGLLKIKMLKRKEKVRWKKKYILKDRFTIFKFKIL